MESHEIFHGRFNYVSPVKARFDIKIKITGISHIESRILFRDLYDFIRILFFLSISQHEFTIDNRRDLQPRSRLSHDNLAGCGFPRVHVGVRLDDL